MASDATAGYAFYLPLSVRVWAEVAGFDSIVLLVGSEWREQTQGYTQVVIEALAASGARVVVLDVPAGSYTLSTVAQLSRILAACALELEPSDFLLMMDVDMWPLSPSHFADAAAAVHLNFSHSIVMHDAFCCGAKPVAWSGFRSRDDSVDPDRDPLWYRVYAAGKGVGATVGIWQEILGPYLHSTSGVAAKCIAPHAKQSHSHSAQSGGEERENKGRGGGLEGETLAHVTEGDMLAHVTMRLIDTLLVAPFEMGKLGNANRRELELSGRYGYGQVRGRRSPRSATLGAQVQHATRLGGSTDLPRLLTTLAIHTLRMRKGGVGG